jgi:hypothetical protein
MNMTRHYPVHDTLLLPPQARVALEGAKTALSKQLADAQRLCAAAGEECARVRKRNEQARTARAWHMRGAWCIDGACAVHARCRRGAGRGAGVARARMRMHSARVATAQVERQLAAEAERRKATGVDQVSSTTSSSMYTQAACTLKHHAHWICTADMYCITRTHRVCMCMCMHDTYMHGTCLHAYAGARRPRAAGGACGQDAGGGLSRE